MSATDGQDNYVSLLVELARLYGPEVVERAGLYSPVPTRFGFRIEGLDDDPYPLLWPRRSKENGWYCTCAKSNGARCAHVVAALILEGEVE